MATNGWSRTFDDPIPLPGGSDLRTSRDAGHYISSLPKRTHDSPAWEAAIETLMLVVEHGGPTMMPRIAIMQALNTGKAEPAPPPRKKAAKRYRVVR